MKVKSLFASNFQLVLVQSFDLQLSILRLDIDILLSFYIAIILPWGPDWLLRCVINWIHKKIEHGFLPSILLLQLPPYCYLECWKIVLPGLTVVVLGAHTGREFLTQVSKSPWKYSNIEGIMIIFGRVTLFKFAPFRY